MNLCKWCKCNEADYTADMCEMCVDDLMERRSEPQDCVAFIESNSRATRREKFALDKNEAEF